MAGLLEPEFEPHYNSWKTDPSPKNTSAMIKALNPVVESAVRTYVSPGADSPTLRSKAKLIMVNALKTYDPARAKLRTHMMSQLQGLRRAAAKETQILSIPEQVAIDLGRINEAENFLRDKLGRDPSDLELADHTGISRKRLGYVRGARPVISEGALTNVAGEEGNELYMPQVEQPEEIGAWHDFVYHDLDPVDQIIMEHSFGMHGKPSLSNQAIAKKLRISPGAVSQRKARIQNKLNQRDELELL